MDTPLPNTALPSTPPTAFVTASAATEPRLKRAATMKLLLIAGLIVLLQLPLMFVNGLRQEREKTRTGDETTLVVQKEDAVFDAYRMVERALKHGVLVMALVFTAFFLFEVLGGLRLHAVHYLLVGAALCLFYLALLALGEVFDPGIAYVAAAVASSALIVGYSAAVLRTWARGGLIAGLLAAVHSVLFVVLRMEAYALLAGTAALFAALGAVMFFTRNVDWDSHEATATGGAR